MVSEAGKGGSCKGLDMNYNIKRCQISAKETGQEKQNDVQQRVNEFDENHHQGFDLIFEKLKWMNTTEASFYLRISKGQVRNMVYRGQLKYYKFRNRLRFLKNDLDQLMKPQIEEKS